MQITTVSGKPRSQIAFSVLHLVSPQVENLDSVSITSSVFYSVNFGTFSFGPVDVKAQF